MTARYPLVINGTSIQEIQPGDTYNLGVPETLTLTNATGLPLTSGVTGSLPIVNGGTGQTTQSAAFNALSPITTTGDLIIGNGSSSATRLSIGTNGQVLTSNGTTATWANASSGTSLQATANGNINAGNMIIVNSDGTVSAVAGETTGIKTTSTFSSATIDTPKCAYDTTNNKIVIAYVNGSNQGQCVVGIISGSNITYGTPVTFNAATTSVGDIKYDSFNQKVIITYYDGGASKGKCIVGTVSGNSISFGTAVIFANEPVNGLSAYNPVTGSIVIQWQVSANGYIAAVAGTVSGTSITFGTAVVFLSVNINAQYNLGTPIIDTATNAAAFTYRIDSPANGYLIAASISGNTLSFGSAILLDAGYMTYPSLFHDPYNLKNVAFYWDQANTGNVYARIFTISGNTISLGNLSNAGHWGTRNITFDSTYNKIIAINSGETNTSVIVSYISGSSLVVESTTTILTFGTNSSSNQTNVGCAYDPISKRTIICYKDVTDSNKGKIGLFATGFTNLTTNNFIGCATSSYTNGQTATIQLNGTVNENQTGLTPVTKYYVLIDGTLSSTAGTPSVYAGLAVSANKIIIKG